MALVGGEEDLRVEPLGPEELLHLRRRVELRLQDLRRDRLPHRRLPRQVAEDRAAATMLLLDHPHGLISGEAQVHNTMTSRICFSN